MHYKFLPPGNYFIWRIGTVGSMLRWLISVALGISILCVWYFFFHRPLIKVFTPSIPAYIATNEFSKWHKELADLAQTTVPCSDINVDAKESYENNIVLLQLCEKSGLLLQSCTCQKPLTKNKVCTQQVHFVCSGTLVQCSTLLNLVASSSIPIAKIECSLKKQHAQEYSITLITEYIITHSSKEDNTV